MQQKEKNYKKIIKKGLQEKKTASLFISRNFSFFFIHHPFFSLAESALQAVITNLLLTGRGRASQQQQQQRAAIPWPGLGGGGGGGKNPYKPRAIS